MTLPLLGNTIDASGLNDINFEILERKINEKIESNPKFTSNPTWDLGLFNGDLTPHSSQK